MRYRWVSGVYLQDKHFRVVWRACPLDGKVSSVKKYDGREKNGQFSKIKRMDGQAPVPEGWKPTLLFFAKVTEPTVELD